MSFLTSDAWLRGGARHIIADRMKALSLCLPTRLAPVDGTKDGTQQVGTRWERCLNIMALTPEGVNECGI